MRVLAVVNEANAEAVRSVDELAAFFAERGDEFVHITARELPACEIAPASPAEELARSLGGSFELVVVLGGDGTILRTARVARVLDAPVLGVNFGHLGFLANPCEQGVVAAVAAALRGEAAEERRANVTAEVVTDAGTVSCFAFNEVAVARGASGRIVDFSLAISGDDVAHMRGDGVVVATATGSTAYALSAGGPLVSPGHQGMVVVPIAPHTLVSRAMVTEAHDVVDVALGPERADVSVFVDGDALEVKGQIRRVRVRKGERPTRLLRLGHHGFYRHIADVFMS